MSPVLLTALRLDYPAILGPGRDGQGGRAAIECGDGWESVIRQAIMEMACLGFQIRITRIREKYGLLRIDAVPNTDRRSDAMERSLDAVLLQAEERSARICEVCGKPGDLAVSSGGWRLTRCDGHLQDATGRPLHRMGSVAAR